MKNGKQSSQNNKATANEFSYLDKIEFCKYEYSLDLVGRDTPGIFNCHGSQSQHALITKQLGEN